MTLNYDDTIYGYIPDPDNDATATIYNADWATGTIEVDLARYRISHGRASAIGPTKRVKIVSGTVYVDPGPVPISLIASAAVGGTMRLDWQIGDTINHAVPDDYKIYTVIDGVEALVATVTHSKHRSKHRYTTVATYTESTTFRIKAHRLVSAVDYYSDSLDAVGIPDYTGPNAIDAPVIT